MSVTSRSRRIKISVWSGVRGGRSICIPRDRSVDYDSLSKDTLRKRWVSFAVLAKRVWHLSDQASSLGLRPAVRREGQASTVAHDRRLGHHDYSAVATCGQPGSENSKLILAELHFCG